jgi:hypothetical protein
LYVILSKLLVNYKIMSFEQPKSQKEVFMDKVRIEVKKFVDAGRLTEEQAEIKLANGEKVEEGFSDNPENDAETFAYAGVATEEELVEMFNRQKGNK